VAKLQRITTWNPEDPVFWEREGKRHAMRNLWISVPCLFLAFAVWQIWSVTAAKLNSIGFHFTKGDLLTLASLPGLVGATLRIIFTYMPGIMGGKNWTAISTLALIIPALGIGFAVQDPGTSFTEFALWSALLGIGGANFSSSMANISLFFPKRMKGFANGINAGFGNLGVSAVQFLTPIVIAASFLYGDSQPLSNGGKVWLQNAAFIWVIPCLIFGIAAFLWMDNLPGVKQSIREQSVIYRNKHTWIMSWLYTMCFGSFIGYSAAFPLLISFEFPEKNAVGLAFLGPLVGACLRPVGGFISDKIGGARVTFWDTVVMIGATVGVIYFLSIHSFGGFLGMFILLFMTTGIANGSTFRMIPYIFEAKQAAAVLGFTAAIGAYGAFIIPKIFGWSLDQHGSANPALYLFLAYYASCLVITWLFYYRKNAPVQC
jgi:MFS transporter, NNP family, nitrate/nitrite transporter